MAGKAGGPNTTKRVIAVGAAGAPTPIYSTGPTRGWRIIESPGTVLGAAQASQGYQVLIPNDNSANGYTQLFTRPAVTAGVSPLELGFENWNRISEHGPYGEVFGGKGNPLPSSVGVTTDIQLCSVQSLTATPTTIEIEEFF